MNIYQSIASVMKEGYAITKSKKNPQQGFMYRGIDDVMNVFQPLMAEAGIFVVPEVLEATREERQTGKGTNLIYSILKIRYTFYASDGTSVSAVVIGEGMDSGDKASNKALSVGMKYAMFQVFCVPTEELVDPDGEAHEPSKPKQPEAKPLKPLPKQQAPKPEPKPEPLPPLPVQKYVCAGCKKEIKPYKDANGKYVSLMAHAERSKQLYGAVLCLDCIKGGTQNA